MPQRTYEFFNNESLYMNFKIGESDYIIQKLKENCSSADRDMNLKIHPMSLVFSLQRTNKVSEKSVGDIIQFLESDLKDLKSYIDYYEDRSRGDLFKILNKNSLDVKNVSEAIILLLDSEVFSDWVEIPNIVEYFIKNGLDVKIINDRVFYKNILLDRDFIPLREEYKDMIPDNLKFIIYKNNKREAYFSDGAEGSSYNELLERLKNKKRVV